MTAASSLDEPRPVVRGKAAITSAAAMQKP